MKKYIHLGSRFDPSKFNPVQNRTNDTRILNSLVNSYATLLGHYNKPIYGFWASPVGDDYYTWSEWTKGEDFYDDYESIERYEFTLNNNVKIMKISTYKEFMNIPDKYFAVKNSWLGVLNYERIAEDYDAIEVIVSRDERLKHYLFDSWDVDTLLIFNPECMCLDYLCTD